MENILDKIKRVLKLAESANEHEAATAIRRANEMLVKYCINEEQVDAWNTGRKAKTGIGFETVSFPNNSYKWAQVLVFEITAAFCTKLIIVPRAEYRRGYDANIFGTKTDRVVSITMIQFAFSTIARLVKEERRRGQGLGRGRSYLHNFKIGVSEAMVKTLRQLNRENDENETYGIILRDKIKDAEKLAYETHKDLVRTQITPKLKGDSDGYYNGRSKGAGIQFNKAIEN